MPVSTATREKRALNVSAQAGNAFDNIAGMKSDAIKILEEALKLPIEARSPWQKEMILGQTPVHPFSMGSDPCFISSLGLTPWKMGAQVSDPLLPRAARPESSRRRC